MNRIKTHKVISGVLALLSVTSLALLYLCSRPQGIDGVAFTRLLNAGSIPESHALISNAERHGRLLPYEQLGLWGILMLTALLSIFSFLRSHSIGREDA